MIDHKLSKLWGLNPELEIFWDIFTAQKDCAYIVTLYAPRCVDEYARATESESRCKKVQVVKNISFDLLLFRPQPQSC